MYRSLRGLGAEASLSFNVGPSTFGASSGSSGGYKPMDICANKGGTKFMSYNNVGGWNATCNNGQSCQKTSSITDPVCTFGSSGSAPPPPPPPAASFWGIFPKAQAATAALMAKPGSTAIKIGATGTNRPGPSASQAAPTVTYFPSSGAKASAPPTVSRLVGPNLYRMPSGALVDVTPGSTANNGGEDVIGEDNAKTYLVIGLGLLVAAGVGYVAYKRSSGGLQWP